MNIDSTLLIGFSLDEAREYLEEEGISYLVITTSASRSDNQDDSGAELRIIGTRGNDPVELICARQTWSINS